MADVLHTFLKDRKIRKTYLGITRNVPDIKKGIIKHYFHVINKFNFHFVNAFGSL